MDRVNILKHIENLVNNQQKAEINPNNQNYNEGIDATAFIE